MAKPNPQSADTDPRRVGAIAAAIHAACLPVSGLDGTRNEAQEALNDAASKARGGREGILVELAALSQAQQWEPAEIELAVARAAAMNNDDEDKTTKSLAVFISETKRATHPNVRAHVPSLVALRDLTWSDEKLMKKADKEAPAPISKAWSREYHYLLALFGEAQKGRVITTAAECVAFADLNNPDLDPAKVDKRLKAAQAEIQKIYRDFPCEDLAAISELFNDITKADLIKARALRASVGNALAPVAAPDMVNAAPQAEVELPTVVDSVAPMEGVVEDFLESALAA